MVVTVLLVWAPLLALTLAEGNFWTGSVKLPFLHDVEMHLRLLLALPLLIMAELLVHQRIRPMVSQFVQRDLIPNTDQPRFHAAIESAMRLRNSITVEVLLMASVYLVGVGFIWRTQVALDVASWYGVEVNGKLHPTLAGWWMGCVSIPVFQFLLFRWYFRLFIWVNYIALHKLSCKQYLFVIIRTHPVKAVVRSDKSRNPLIPQAFIHLCT